MPAPGDPHHPQGLVQVERFNLALLGMVGVFVKDYQHKCDAYLPCLIPAYHASINLANKFTSHRMVFGIEIKLPTEVTLNSA